MRMVKTFFILIIGLELVLAATACRNDTPVSQPSAQSGPNSLRFDVAAPFISLSPAEGDMSGATMIFPLLYSYLCVPDADGRLQPDLAESWAYDQSTRTWTINLRQDAYFHDGRPVTAEEVCCSFQTILRNVQPVLMESIKDIHMISNHILTVQLNRHDPAFMRKIWTMEIVPCRDMDNGGQYPPIGSGPFVFFSREGEQKVVLKANQHYYAGRPALDGVIFYYQPDQEKTWTRLLAGETDIARELSPKNFEMTRQYQDRFYFHDYTLESYSILLYNTHDPLFADASVRQSLTRAVNRQYIVDTILNGYGRVAVGPMGVDSPFHLPDLVSLAYDPHAALEELQATGWTMNSQKPVLEKNGRAFAFNLLVPEETQIEKTVARYIQLCFNDIGIHMDIHARPYKAVVARYSKNTDFQAVLTEFPGAYRQAETTIKGWMPDDNGKTLAGNFHHPEVTSLLYQARRASDLQAQKKYLFQAEARIAALQPGSFLFHKTALDVMSRRFNLTSPFTLTYEGLYRLRLATLAHQ